MAQNKQDDDASVEQEPDSTCDSTFLSGILNKSKATEEDRKKLATIAKKTWGFTKRQAEKKSQILAKDCLGNLQGATQTKNPLTQWFGQKTKAKETSLVQTSAAVEAPEQHGEKKKNKLRKWVANDIAKSNAKDLVQWARLAGFTLHFVDHSSEEEMSRYLLHRLDEVLAEFCVQTEWVECNTRNLAIKIKTLMATFDVATSIKLSIANDIASASYVGARAWSRRCGFASQTEFPNTCLVSNSFYARLWTILSQNLEMLN